ncbi:MAG: HAD hydrolase-like protein [Holosporaceae bacterium]|jgi:HAD superfamily hydrolase (TIGR01450 family)|nr:HAD hydrolase-like protein [Holosporaceae bacterium]
MNIKMDIKQDILSLADLYDVFFVDIYGVLYNGVSIYDGTLNTMQKLKSMGKKIVILSNTTQVSQDAKLGYSQRGMFENVHYDEMITSGEFLHYFLLNNPKNFSEMVGSSVTRVKCLFMGNNSIFEGAHVAKVSDVTDADFIYVGIPRASYGSVRMDDIFDGDEEVEIENVVNRDWHNLRDSFGRKGFAEFAHALEACVSKNKVLVVANPDIFAYGSISDNPKKVPIITQGCIGKYYEKLGGKVVYFGKPHAGIFEYAKQFANPGSRTAMIGDTPWTDIVGANNCSIDSILVMTGITDEFCSQMDHALSDREKINVLLDKVAKKMSDFPGNIRPTHVIKQFAKYDGNM